MCHFQSVLGLSLMRFGLMDFGLMEYTQQIILKQNTKDLYGLLVHTFGCIPALPVAGFEFCLVGVLLADFVPKRSCKIR